MDDSLYDELWRTEQTHWWFVARRKIIVSLVDRYSGQESSEKLRICELGCGTGGNISAWADQHDIMGVDASEKALKFARQRIGPRAVYGRLPDEVPLQPESFDVVLLSDVFEHIEDDTASAATALNLLRPGGILVATVPAFQWLYSPRDAHHQHFRRYGIKQFRRLFPAPEAHVELMSFYNSFLFPPAAMMRQWSKWFGKNSQPGDLKLPPQPLNWALTKLFAWERHLLGRIHLPFGLSLITIVRKQPATPLAAAA